MNHKVIRTGKTPFLACEISEDMHNFSNTFSCMLFYERENNIKKFAYLSSDCSRNKMILGKLSELTKEQQLEFSDWDLKLLIEEAMPPCKSRKQKIDYLILKFV